MPYILALDVSMGHSYSVLYKDDTCFYLKTRSNTLKEDFYALLEEIQHLPERPLIVFLKQRGFIPDQSKSSFKIITFLTVC